MNEKVRAAVLGVVLVAMVAGLVYWFRSHPAPQPAPEPKAAGPVTVPPTKSGHPLLMEVGSSAGPADLMMAAVMTALREGFGNKLEIEFVNAGKDPSLKEKYGVVALPTQIYFSPEGKELYRHQAFAQEQEILDQWKKLGYDLFAEPAHRGQGAPEQLPGEN